MPATSTTRKFFVLSAIPIRPITGNIFPRSTPSSEVRSFLLASLVKLRPVWQAANIATSHLRYQPLFQTGKISRGNSEELPNTWELPSSPSASIDEQRGTALVTVS